jgi:DNA-binding CsgD family transcriptional regulator
MPTLGVVPSESSAIDPKASDAAGALVRDLRARLTAGGLSRDSEAEVRLALVRALYAQHRHAETIIEGGRLVGDPDTPPAIRDRALGSLAGAYAQHGQPDDARRAADRALAAPDVDAETRVLARSALRGLAFLEGRYERAVDEARAAVELAHDAGSVGRAEARIDLGGMLSHVDAFDEAARWLALDDDAAAHQRREADELLATMDLVAGRWATVLDRLHAPRDAGLDADRSQASVTIRVGLRAAAWLHLDRREQAQRELVTGPRPGAPHPVALVVSALVADADGDTRGAGALLERVMAWADEYPYPPLTRIWGPEIVRIALLAGDPATADRVARSLDEAVARTSVASVHGAALAVRGRIERDPELLGRAVTAYAEGPRRVDHAGALEAVGDVALARGARDDGVAALRAAHDAFRHIGADRDVRRVARRLASVGVRTGRGPASRARLGWDALTPTETTVAVLIGEGLSNAAIAGRLMVSRRTVETHVGHVLAKLDVPSRAAVARVVATHDAPNR